MAQHKPTSTWATYMDRYPRVYVGTENETQISISLFGDSNGRGHKVVLDRTHARLLARRINQCLEDTK